MEPLLSIIVAVARVFGNPAADETTRRTMGELWERAKQVIVTKFGAAHLAPRLMDEMRRTPTMSAAEHVAAQLTASNVTNDPDVARVFKELSALAKGTSDDAVAAVGMPQARNAWPPINGLRRPY